MCRHIMMCRQEEYYEIKEESNLAYSGMLVRYTFLVQVQPKLAVIIGQLSVLAHEIMIHVPALIVHAL
jgi:hypothetical protein